MSLLLLMPSTGHILNYYKSRLFHHKTPKRKSIINPVRARLKRDGTRAETRFSLSEKRTSSFKLERGEGGSVQSSTGSRGVRISGSNGSNDGYTMF